MAQNMNQANIKYLDAWRAAGNTGDLPVGWTPGGSQGGGVSIATPQAVDPNKIAQNYTTFYSKARDAIGTNLKPTTDKLTNYADRATQIADQKAQGIIDLAPTYQEIYRNLALQLRDQFQNEASAISDTKDSEVGKSKAASARAGFDTTTGYESDQQRIIKDQYDTQLAAVARSYGLKFEQLKNEQTKDLKQLQIDAYTALAEGNTQAANIIGQVANVLVQQEQLAVSATNAMQSAQSEAEALEYKKVYDAAMMNLENQKLNLQALKIQLDDQNAKEQLDQGWANVALSRDKFAFDKAQAAKAGAKKDTPVYPFNDATMAAGVAGMPISQEGNKALAVVQSALNQDDPPRPSISVDPEKLTIQNGQYGLSKDVGAWWNPGSWGQKEFVPIPGLNATQQGTPTSAPVTVRMTAPDGKVYNVPASEVESARQNGWK